MREEIADGSDGFPKLVVGSFCSFPDQGFELGEGHLERIEDVAESNDRGDQVPSRVKRPL